MAESAWTDEPLQAGTQDTLGRRPYATQAAKLIHATHSFESSAVFGLSGPWGSGKTSLVNMIVDELQREHPTWTVARFTPWATSDVPSLLDEFYASLAEALPKKRGREAKRALAITAAVATPAANLIPFAGGVAAQGAKIAADALAKKPSWQSAFKRAAKEFKDLRQPVLVVVDDIDRLHVDELMALLKVVRLLGRFDGVQYLLAYDDKTLHRSLAARNAVEADDGSAERFMEKIVQYPLFVPPLMRHQQLSRLNVGLAGVSREDDTDGSSEARLNGLAEAFLALLTTPRAIDRYVAQLRHHLPLLPPEEVDDVDVMLLTLVRVTFPALFSTIPLNRTGLVSGNTGELAPDVQEMRFKKFDVTPLLEQVTAGLRPVARRLLVALFPEIRNKDEIVTYSSVRRQSVHNDEYFDRYFAMEILDNDVSDAVVEAAVLAATQGDANSLSRLLRDADDDLRGLILTKGSNSTNHPTSDEGRLNLAGSLASISGDLPPDDSGPFSNLEQIFIWFSDVMLGLTRDVPPLTVRALTDRFDDTTLRIRAWGKLELKVDRAYRLDPPDWFVQTTDHLVGDAINRFLENLSEGDRAPTRTGVGYQVRFALRHDPERIRAGVLALFDQERVDLSTLASRLVSVRSLNGVKPDWHLSPEFNQDTFNQIAPTGEDDWYDEPIREVDIRDLSWANRRNFVAGRVAEPPNPR